ncbi:DUF3109 family protein [Alkalitalea saponilacus]|uniref:DUF3109 family protein n=1 Tax=Alkalitalea saponilacus TaxID=889453 RepID=A0A1T5BHE0_9BACT|nr:DUF3109 family protein [Alkalitalea saponilacus]ASB49684.1 hypothetical protein CDL62_11315 [Alkalitalea saponilacus]SKB46722.1 Protein of unknown function [Alkalitalea saponilacus]
MVQIDDKLISLDLFEKHFICDLPKCLGACCVEGESGAPLEEEETTILEKILPIVKPMLSEKAQAEIDKNGAWEVDGDGDMVTPIINGRECVYALFDEKGICKCAIEQAYNEGKVEFRKPVSCHLYPIRVSKYKDFEAINYHQWHICEAARLLGEKEQVPVFRFLKDAITRKYGEPFYNEMEEAAKLLEENPPDSL